MSPICPQRVSNVSPNCPQTAPYTTLMRPQIRSSFQDGRMDNSSWIQNTYFTIEVDSYVYPTMSIYKTSGAKSQGDCAAWCQIKEEHRYPMYRYVYCGFFVYENGVCVLGNFTRIGAPLVEQNALLKKLHVHRERMQFTVDKIFSSAETKSDWAANVYKNVTLKDEESAELACASYCVFDSRFCYFFGIDYPICYLGDPNVDADFVTSTDELLIYERTGLSFSSAQVAFQFCLSLASAITYILLSITQFCPHCLSTFSQFILSFFLPQC